jgi:small conductance mechanosensitive channel
MEELSIDPQEIIRLVREYGWNVVKAGAILFIGIKVINMLVRGMSLVMDKREFDPSLKPFLRSLVRNLLTVVVVITSLNALGVEMTSFIALLGAAGLAVGLSLQGTLQNFAGGVVLLTLRPFKVGDFIDSGGLSGKVKEIRIFNTILTTPDNKRITVPNGQLSNNAITNFTAEETRRVDLVFGISYSDDMAQAKNIILQVLEADPRILKDPAPVVAVSALADSSVNLITRPWVKTEDYWAVYWDTTEGVKAAFDAQGVSIPFPQRDVHLYQEK